MLCAPRRAPPATPQPEEDKMDISSIKGTLVAQLKAKAGLDDAQAKQAADVVENLLKEHGPKLLSGVADKLPDGIADALGGFLGGKK
jgi:hypothetical protein